MTLITLVELQGNPGTGATTYYFASGAGYSHPSAPAWYEPALVQPADYKRVLVADGGTTSTTPTFDYGELLLASPGGQFDYLLTTALAGWPMTVKLVDDQAAYGTAITVLTAIVQLVETSTDMKSISITFADPTTLLDTPTQLSTYGGTNALPAGVDGVATDLKGLYKPVCYGHAYNVPPVLVNTSCWVYQVADKLLYDIPTVRINGVAITRGSSRADVSTMLANTPSAGTYDYCLTSGGSYFRLVSASGQVTCDAMEGSTTAARTIAQVLNRLLQERAGVSSGSVSSSDLTAVDALVSGEVGIWYGTGAANIRDAMDKIAQTGGVWYVPDETGTWRFGRITAPAGTPALTLRRFNSTSAGALTDIDIISITGAAPTDQGYGNPAWSIAGQFAPFFATQTSGLAGSVAVTDITRLGAAWLQSTAQDASIKTVWPKAQTFTPNLYFTSRTDADTETARRLALYKVRRDRYTAVCRLSSATGLLGKVVNLVLNRADLTSGKLFLVIGIMYDARTGNAELDLWG